MRAASQSSSADPKKKSDEMSTTETTDTSSTAAANKSSTEFGAERAIGLIGGGGGVLFISLATISMPISKNFRFFQVAMYARPPGFKTLAISFRHFSRSGTNISA
eukprot:CAMPEP_0194781270 /NCGR_PEP_ID=MMETSP0323_2-20130528/75881_1 /TAXON_ID=2866 ORGANISM="Crypthecodinium cohnii, Strain Seligo" /NCGR_SAMPLE_ID=MMETSP0323_2 /ASSEMBLY_ACC=CAM_ASM_000346 /LENGTH=104 /DNA_ID=CAMNT_0039719609 /DNA_START=183 /DNA_END=497 /DNA_ORIENTATION=-